LKIDEASALVFHLNTDIRKISHSKCIDEPHDRKDAFGLDFERSQFIVKKKFATVAGSRLLGQMWLILDPMIQAAIYFFVLVVLRAREDPQSLIIGITYVRILQRGLGDGFNGAIDYSGGIKIERVRTRVFLMAEGILGLTTSFFMTIGVVVGFVLYFGESITEMLAFMVLAYFLYLFWYVLGSVLSPAGIFIPDLKAFVTYFGMLMFFASPAIYTLGQTTGAHRQLSLINPFSYFVEAARAIIIGSEDYNLLSTDLGVAFAIFFLLATFLSIRNFDKLRWRFSTWS